MFRVASKKKCGRLVIQKWSKKLCYPKSPSSPPSTRSASLTARSTTAAVLLDTTANDVNAMTGRVGPAKIALALSLAWLFIGRYILSLHAALYRAMVSLLPAGRALSIVTNTVARTVAENRGAYRELFPTLLLLVERQLKKKKKKRYSRIIIIF